MAFAILLIGLVLVVAAVRNSQADLFKQLGEDIPAFGVWAAAILALGAIGFVPGLKPISRGLLFLVILVILINNYKTIETGLRGAWSNASSGTGAGSSNSSSSSNSGGILGALNSANSAANSFSDFADQLDSSGTLSALDKFGSSIGL